MALDELAITMATQGAGEWELHLESDETVTASLDEVAVGEERGFHAEGRAADGEARYELTTGTQPGGDIRLRRRPLDADEWHEVGTVTDAVKRG